MKQKNEYSIYDFFRGHPGFLAACISGVVAALSFVFNFAITRYNYEYLKYWEIDTVYAMNNTNRGQVYLVLAGFMYFLVLMAIHAFISETVDTYIHYREYRERLKINYKELKKGIKELKKIRREENGVYKNLSNDTSQSDLLIRLEKTRLRTKELFKKMRALKKKLRENRWWMFFIILISCIISFAVGLIFLLLMQKTINMQIVIRSSGVVLAAILFDLVGYFFVHWLHRPKKKNKEKIEEKTEDMKENREKIFPILQIVENGFKSLATNKKIKSAISVLVVITVFYLFVVSVGGKEAAAEKRDFLIYHDDFGTYTVVYNDGDFVILEQVEINGKELIVDTTKQRVLEASNIMYERKEFEDVKIIR